MDRKPPFPCARRRPDPARDSHPSQTWRHRWPDAKVYAGFHGLARAPTEGARLAHPLGGGTPPLRVIMRGRLAARSAGARPDFAKTSRVARWFSLTRQWTKDISNRIALAAASDKSEGEKRQGMFSSATRGRLPFPPPFWAHRDREGVKRGENLLIRTPALTASRPCRHPDAFSRHGRLR